MVFIPHRENNNIVKQLPDLLAKGAKTLEILESLTLKTYNQKMKSLCDGDLIVPEVDEIGIVDFTFETADKL